MCPILFHLGSLPVFSYGLMLAIAVLAAGGLAARRAEKELGLKRDTFYDMVFWIVLLGILGARLFYVFLNFDYFWEKPLDIVMLNKGGLAWQGSLLAGLVTGWLYIKRSRLPALKTIDVLIPYVALGQAIGRIGCFLNGCCFGYHADWGIYFPVHDDTLVPTQLFMTAGQLIIFVVLRLLQERPHRTGQILIWYLMLSAVDRFIIEFFRADHILYYGFSLFQYVSVAVFIAALVIALRIRKNKEKC